MCPVPRGSRAFAHFLFLILSVCLVFSSGQTLAQGHAGLRVSKHEHEPHELLVKFHAGSPSRHAESAMRGEGAKEIVSFAKPRRLATSRMNQWRLLRFGPGVDIDRVRARLLKNRHVERVEYNYKVSIALTPNDPRYPELWGLNNVGQTGGKPDGDIDAPEAWDLQTGDQNVLVAVIDTGVDYNHPDLATNIWTNPGEIPGNGIDDDGNGYVDDIHGYDFVNNDGDPMDDHGHGTHCAGTIAGEGNNGIGVVGVSWRARIMGVKFLSASGSGTTAAAIQAVLYAADMGAKVMSNSWGGGGYSQALNDAIVTADQAGALFVAAAGNSNSNNDVTPNYPSNYDVPNVLAVAATDHNDLKASFSSYGATTVDLGAPGVSILSTVPTAGSSCCSDPSGYKLLSGTSMATPHVSGAAALLFAQFPGVTHHQVKDRLMSSAEPVAALQGITVTGGRLNIASAFEDDTTPPAAVTDLAPANTGAYTITLGWGATGDDGMNGTASAYELRYAITPIDETNFNDATLAGYVPVTGPAGTIETYTISGLDPTTQYFVALKVRDNVGNVSPLSNVAVATTKAVQIVFADDFEAGTGKWSIAGSDGVGGPALWHLSGHRVSSPANAFYYGKESTLTYDTGARNFGSITSVPVNLDGAVDSTLSFKYFLATEGGSFYDVARVQASNNGGASWTDLQVLPTSTAGMSKRVISLAAYDGQTIQVRFFFDTVDSIANAYEGWVLDDVVVSATSLEDDTTPPAPVGDLAASAVTTSATTLTWTAPGDDGNVGTASNYDLRRSTAPIDESNFAAATPVAGVPAPAPAGTPQSFEVTGLSAGTTYYFALKSSDNLGNVSPISNVVSVTTVPEIVAFNDDFESGMGSWTVAGSDGVGGGALWHISSHRSASPVNAMYYGMESTLNYNTGARNFGSITSSQVSLVNVQQAQLTFKHFLATENLSPYDTARVQVSNDNGVSWIDIYVTAMSTGGLIESKSFSLSNYEGQVIRLRFSFDTVDSVANSFEGWVIDDVVVKGTEAPNVPPVANAGGPYTGVIGTPIEFDGSGSSDPNGTPLTYAWDFGDGTTGTGIAATHAYAARGSYTATLVVNDGVYYSAPATTSVNIVNRAPIAIAGGPYTVAKNKPLTFDGSQSNDPDGDPIVSYSWDFGDGATGTGPNPVHSYATTGEYTVTLVVNDGTADSVPATATATVTNAVPTANPGGPYAVEKNKPLALDGSASSDPDGDSLTYQWDFGDGASGSGVSPSHTYTATGTYTATLIVNDGEVSSPAVTTTVTVSNQAPTADPGGPYTVQKRKVLTLDGSLSSDPNGDALTYQWDFGDGETGTGVAPTHAYTKSGIYTVTLVVNDGEVSSAPVSTTVTVTNSPPVASFEGVDKTYQHTTNWYYAGASSDADGDPLTYQWDFGDGSFGTGVNPSHTFGGPGTFTVSLVVNDGEVDSAPATMTVTVLNRLPVANAGPDQTVKARSTVYLSGWSSSDPDGTIVSYSWKQIAGTGVALAGADTGRAEFVAPKVQGGDPLQLVFELTVTDDDGGTGTDQVVVTVTH